MIAESGPLRGLAPALWLSGNSALTMSGRLVDALGSTLEVKLPSRGTMSGSVGLSTATHTPGMMGAQLGLNTLGATAAWAPPSDGGTAAAEGSELTRTTASNATRPR